MLDKEVVLKVNDLHKEYFKTKALDGISFELGQNKISGLLGPNGSGKSTTLKLIAGLLKPSTGSIMVCSMAPSMHTKKLISYLPELDYLYPWMTVKQMVEFISPFYKDWDFSKSKELLQYLKLEENMVIKKLSKGMRAKLKLLIALSRRTPLMLLDEPLSGIDYPTRSKLIEAIVGEYREEGQSVILSTHEVNEAEGIFDEVIFLDKGTMKLQGNADELRDQYRMSISELLKEVYPA